MDVAVQKPLLRGWSHVVAFLLAAVLGGVMIALAPGHGRRLLIVIYVVGLCSMFGVSALYHRGRWTGASLAFMRRLDHSTIFLAIAGTYTPIAATALDGWQRPTVLAVVWIGAVVGITLQWTPTNLPRWFETLVYAVVGWSVVIAVPQLLDGLGPTAFALTLGGGLAYTAGAVVYALKRPDPWPTVFGYHEVFHALTIVGAGLHLAVIGLFIVGR